MKILTLLPNDDLGGAEQYLKMVMSYHKNDAVDIFFLNEKLRNSWEDIGPLTSLHYQKKNNKIFTVLRFMLKIAKLDNQKYDYIYTSHVYTTGIIGIMLRLRLLTTKHFVARESTSIFLRFTGLKLISYKLFYWLGYRKVDLLICQTNLMKDQLIDGFPKLERWTKIKVIPNPIDLGLIEKKMSEQIHKNHPKKYIVSAGRFINVKGFDILIQSFFKLQNKYPDLKLIILGDGPEKQGLEQIINQLDIKEKVILPGFVDNVYPYFKNAQACIVSSRVEGFPNVLLQMMSQNTKVVSTICAGGIDKIEGVFTCEINSITTLSDTMKKCLEANTMLNRMHFDGYLEKRKIGNFIKDISDTLTS